MVIFPEVYSFDPAADGHGPRVSIAVSLLSLGEGWHDYHHLFPWDYAAAAPQLQTSKKRVPGSGPSLLGPQLETPMLPYLQYSSIFKVLQFIVHAHTHMYI